MRIPNVWLFTQARGIRVKYHKTSTASRRKTPWDFKGADENLSASERFIKHTYLDTYTFRHPKIRETEEIEFLNSIEPYECPMCGSEEFTHWGQTRSGINRYHCNRCKSTFNITTNTLFQDRKISLIEWVDYLIRILGHESFLMASYEGRNSGTTTKYWTAKLFRCLEGYQDGTLLYDRVMIDETYIPLRWSNREIREDGKQYRGLSKNQMCIAVGIDNHGQYYFEYIGQGKPSGKRAMASYGRHVKPGSVLIHDSERSHKSMVKSLELESHSYDSRKLKTLPDDENPMAEIDDVCFLLKHFLHAHSGFKEIELQGYLNLFAFYMNPPNDTLEKVRIIILCNLYLHKTLKYRDYYIRNPR